MTTNRRISARYPKRSICMDFSNTVADQFASFLQIYGKNKRLGRTKGNEDLKGRKESEFSSAFP